MYIFEHYVDQQWSSIRVLEESTNITKDQGAYRDVLLRAVFIYFHIYISLNGCAFDLPMRMVSNQEIHSSGPES